MAQAAGHSCREPLVIIKQDRSRPLAVVDFDHFMELVARAHQVKKTPNT
jgi:hypothetical protein